MSRVIHVTDENFDELIGKSIKPVLVDFWATWCGPCKAIAPVLEEISENSEDIIVAKIDVDANPQTAAKYHIRSIPTLMLFKDSQIAATKIGAGTKPQIQAFIDNNA